MDVPVDQPGRQPPAAPVDHDLAVAGLGEPASIAAIRPPSTRTVRGSEERPATTSTIRAPTIVTALTRRVSTRASDRPG